MICPHCGARSVANAEWCSQCLTRFEPLPAPNSLPNPQIAPPPAALPAVNEAPVQQAPASKQLPACYWCGNHTLRWENRPIIREEREPLTCLWLVLVLFSVVGLAIWLASKKPRVVGYEQVLICWTCGATQQLQAPPPPPMLQPRPQQRAAYYPQQTQQQSRVTWGGH